MAKDSKIEWTMHTANLWWGCVEVHAGCDHCYAKTLDKRYGGGQHWGAYAPRRAIAGVWGSLASMQAAAAKAGEVHRVFVGSMMDIFERSRPTVDQKGNDTGWTTEQLRDRLFYEVIRSSPNLQFLLLTKRPQNILRMIPESWLERPPTNVIYGYSPVNQETTDQGIPALLSVPGRHFLSCEPLLGAIDLTDVQFDQYSRMDVLEGCGISTKPGYGGQTIPNAYCNRIDWVIVGGESGHGARPMHPDWARGIRDQCVASGVPFLFKQWGEYAPISHDTPMPAGKPPQLLRGLRPNGIPLARNDFVEDANVWVWRAGKHAAGRLLDGVDWSQYPA